MNKVNVLIHLVWILFIIAATTVFADIYTWIDENGNPVFSDMAEDGATIIDVEPIQAYSFPKIKNLNATDKEQNEKKMSYEQLGIISPENESTIWNGPGDFIVAAAIVPALLPEHRLQLLLDGKHYGRPSSSTGWGLINIDRGTHTLQLQVVDIDGNIFQRSEVNTFYLHRPSVLFPKGKK